MNCHPCDRNKPDQIGRDGGIRTHDPLTPSQVRYQAALHPVSSCSPFPVPCSRFGFPVLGSEFGVRRAAFQLQRARVTRFAAVLPRAGTGFLADDGAFPRVAAIVLGEDATGGGVSS